MIEKEDYLRLLPSVDRVLQEYSPQVWKEVPRKVLLESVQETVSVKRTILTKAFSERQDPPLDLSPAAVAAEALNQARRKLRPSLRRVINASGVLLHTNLGRAPLAAAAIQALADIAGGYSSLEFSLTEGKRGSRHDHVAALLCTLTGAEAAAVVNNNAAAILLVLNTLAAGREVIVARGQLVEIGGSFRIPEVMKASGARLVEVGTTNKCYLKDYTDALGAETGLLLKVHTSNYRVVGFTASTSLEELVALGKEKNLPVVEDLGSGALVNFTPYGFLPLEPLVQESVKAGADLVTFSGDKLLGGPQAGIIVGKKELVEKVRTNQLARALRVDKLTLAALDATLRLYLDPEKALAEIPVLRGLTAPASTIRRRARCLAALLKKEVGSNVRIRCLRSVSCVGGGAMPLVELPGYVTALSPTRLSVESLVRALRDGKPPVIGRVQEEELLLDPRTLLPGEEKILLKCLLKALAVNSPS